MGLPKQVQEMGDRADELFKNQGTEGENPLAEVKGLESQEPGEDGQTETRETETRETGPTPEPVRQSDDIELLRRENETLVNLNKSFDNENRHLKIRCGELERQLQSKTDEFEQYKQEVVNAPKVSVGDIELTDDERDILESEGISEDVLKILTKQARPAAGNPEYERLQETAKQVKQDTDQLKKERFFDQITAAVPDWAHVNTQQAFLDNLMQLVPYQTYTYQQLLDHAANNNDSATVIKIFQDLRPGKAVKTKKTLSDIAEPTAGRGGDMPTEPGEQWDGQRITDFYNEVRRFPNKYKPEEIEAIERKHILRG